MTHASNLLQFSELIHCFTDRTDGNMGLLERLDEAAKAGAPTNREAVCQRLGISAHDIVRGKQVHGAEIGEVTAAHRGLFVNNDTPFESADAFITNQSNLFLAIFSADCLPLLVYDPTTKEVAAIHAGWQGLSKQIVRKVIERFPEPHRLQVAIGPHIKKCHYRLDPAVESYQAKVAAFKLDPAVRFLDLTSLAMRQLTEQGVQADSIEIGECTACYPEKYFSYHQEAGRHDGLMMNLIGVRE
jgi:YfiH family protein